MFNKIFYDGVTFIDSPHGSIKFIRQMNTIPSIKQVIFPVAFFFMLFSCAEQRKSVVSTDVALTRYVDPYIGTGFHGHVFLGANVPFGAVQLGPVNISEGWDWCSGYHYSDSTIMGFSHTHLSGTGIGDLGDISFMPVIGNVSMERGQ